MYVAYMLKGKNKVAIIIPRQLFIKIDTLRDNKLKLFI